MKYKNNSPWLKELKILRRKRILKKNLDTDVVVIGAGISGIVTSYQILKNTPYKVVCLEGGLLAHGASGHNAGQLVSEFERPYKSIAKEFGQEMTLEAIREIESGWSILEEILISSKIKIPFDLFIGHDGCGSLEELIRYMDDYLLIKKAGLDDIKKVIVLNDAELLAKIPAKYKDCYQVATRHRIQQLLNTESEDYIGVVSGKRGCVNSALFTEKVAEYLLKVYSERFSLFEYTRVDHIDLYTKSAILTSGKNMISCKKVVLCTNGFENINIENHAGPKIQKHFNDNVCGIVGYMSAYFDKPSNMPEAISYYKDEDKTKSVEPYYYLTRRKSYLKRNRDMICIGGPQKELYNKEEYKEEIQHFPNNYDKNTNEFLQQNYLPAKKITPKFEYKWHGLMGYTKNNIRVVGTDPRNHNILYNLGCNGVGIIPSMSGSVRISNILNNKKLKPSIFDPN